MKLWKVFAGLVLASTVLAQTSPQGLLITNIAGISSSWAGECGANTVDNRSQFLRQNTYHAFAAQGSGSWTVTLQYSNTSCTGPWSSYGSGASINQGSSPAVAIATDPPFSPAQFIQIVITGSAVGTYTAQNGLYLNPGSGGGGGGGLPSGLPNLILATNPSGSSTATAALRSMVLADLPTINTTNVPEGSNLYFTGSRAQAAMSGLYQSPITTGTTAQYFRGDLSLATFPTSLSSFTNGPGYLTANQSITWTAGGDASGSASGTTSISPSLTVTGLKGVALPNLTAGNLRYSGSAWALDGTAYQTLITTGTTAQYFRGDLTLATFPTNLSSFTNGPGYITANQSITFTAGGDLSGSASGTTSISPSFTVAGIKGVSLPSLATGNLRYTGGAWTFDSATYLTANQSITWTAGGDASGTANGTTSISPSLTINGLKGVALPVLAAGNLRYTGSAWSFDATSYGPALTFTTPLVNTSNTITLNVWGSGTRPVAASALGTSGNCVAWGAVGLIDVGSPCGTGGSGANALGTYWTASSANAPANAVNLGLLSTGLVKITVSGSVATPSTAGSGTDYAPATSGAAILYGNGAGGFSNVTVGTGLNFSAGTLTNTGSGGNMSTSGSPAQYQVGVWASGTTMTGVGPGAANMPLLGAGASANPGFSTIAYPTSLTGGHLIYASSSTQLADMGTDFTFNTHTLSGVSSAIFDMSAASPTAGLKIPAAAGAAPTADDFLAFNITTHALVHGSNGTTIVSAAAATGTNSATTCSNQVVTAVSGVAAPTCSSLSSSYLPLSAMGVITGGTWNGSVVGPVYGGTGVANGVSNTITFTGNYTLGITLSGNTAVTFPTSGTLSTTTGTVTTVGFTGGLLTVATPTTTPAITVAGTSGGIPYFSSATAWASSGALTANMPVIGGGAGTAPSVGTVSGNTTTFVTTTGALTLGDCVQIDANGNFIDATVTCGGGGGGGVNPGTANHLAYYATTGSAVSDMGSDFTFNASAHSVIAGSSGILNMINASTSNGFRLPTGAAAGPTGDGYLAFTGPTAVHTLVWGYNNTSTMVGAVAVVGSGNTATTCSSQAVTAISGIAAPTCSTITSAYVNNSIALTGTDINTSSQVTVTHLASALPIAQGGTAAITASAALTSLFPTATRAGDVVYWNGSTWTHLSGNNSGTQWLQETASGVPSWTTPVGGAAGSSGQIQVNSSGSLAGFTAGGDVTFSSPNFTVVSTTLTNALPVNQGGTGTKSTLTGLLRGGASTFTAAELSGDAQTSGSNSVTNLKVNGVSYPNTAASFDSLPILTSSNTVGYYQINGGSNCGDGSHALSYNQTSHLIGCQSITGLSAPATLSSAGTWTTDNFALQINYGTPASWYSSYANAFHGMFGTTSSNDPQSSALQALCVVPSSTSNGFGYPCIGVVAISLSGSSTATAFQPSASMGANNSKGWGIVTQVFNGQATGATNGVSQASASTSLTLATYDSATTNIYNGMTILATWDNGTTQVSSTGTVTAYNGSTKVATVSGGWTLCSGCTGSSTPASISNYTIYNGTSNYYSGGGGIGIESDISNGFDPNHTNNMGAFFAYGGIQSFMNNISGYTVGAADGGTQPATKTGWHTLPWTWGFHSLEGVAVAGIQLDNAGPCTLVSGGYCDGNNGISQPIWFTARDTGGSLHYTGIWGDSTGALNLVGGLFAGGSPVVISATGSVTVGQLAGSGSRFLQANSSGTLSSSTSCAGISQQTQANPWFGTPTSSRALSTVYQNNTGCAIYASVTVDVTSNNIIQVYSNSSATPTSGPETAITSNLSISAAADFAVSFWVLPGNYYEVLSSGGSVVFWVEWQ